MAAACLSLRLQFVSSRFLASPSLLWLPAALFLLFLGASGGVGRAKNRGTAALAAAAAFLSSAAPSLAREANASSLAGSLVSSSSAESCTDMDMEDDTEEDRREAADAALSASSARRHSKWNASQSSSG
eukprot:CAMPEP_0170198812 /NCGR_PEP_ID=MMETSP0040_2-20121228/68890_1 /TAXON_ID=641309 /ORGANISM="Lotharella oceanica, Strain CCMP622" /LENGTH=128 /DNA_ID=CAMNT_0010448863 /DNA_START=1315 /DNA_END=1701 /DNA_ORIENTATION=-